MLLHEHEYTTYGYSPTPGYALCLWRDEVVHTGKIYRIRMSLDSEGLLPIRLSVVEWCYDLTYTLPSP